MYLVLGGKTVSFFGPILEGKLLPIIPPSTVSGSD